LHGDGSHHVLAEVCVGVGLAGLIVALLAAGYLLAPRALRFGIASGEALAIAGASGLDSARDFYASVVVLLDEQWVENFDAIRRLDGAFTVVLCGMLVALCGSLLAAAVA
jgi:hypothetical protein